MKFSPLSFLVLALTGCTVYTHHSGGTFRPNQGNNYQGLLVVEFSVDGYQAAEPYMIKECMPYGGFKKGSAYRSSAPKPYSTWGWNIGNTYWNYSCNGLSESPLKKENFNAPAIPLNVDKVEDAKRKCNELGFKLGTEGFGKCVLQLSK